MISVFLIYIMYVYFIVYEGEVCSITAHIISNKIPPKNMDAYLLIKLFKVIHWDGFFFLLIFLFLHIYIYTSHTYFRT